MPRLSTGALALMATATVFWPPLAVAQWSSNRLDCPDLDATGVVDVGDLLRLLAAYGTSPDGDCNGDGATDVADLLVLLAKFGQTCGRIVSVGAQLPQPREVVANVRSRSIHGDYSITRIATGQRVYLDRSYLFEALPEYLEGCPGICTRNNDKHRPPSIETELFVTTTSIDDEEFLCFDVVAEGSMAVYILYDATVAHPPTWLTSRFTRLEGQHTWQQSDNGGRCEDWLDRWTWTNSNPIFSADNGWVYTDDHHDASTCADLLIGLPSGPGRCDGVCNMHLAHGAACDLDFMWSHVETGQVVEGWQPHQEVGEVSHAGPQCECDGTCPQTHVPTCAYDSFCDRSCGYCQEYSAEPGEAEPVEGTSRFDIYFASLPEPAAGTSMCLGDNGAVGGAGNYIVVFGPASPDSPFVGCDGVTASGLYVDICGVCGGEAECVGCDGVPHSGLEVDDCGNCVEPRIEGSNANSCSDTSSELHIMLGGDTMLGRYVDQMLPHGVEHPRDPPFDGIDDLELERNRDTLISMSGVTTLSDEVRLQRPWGNLLSLLREADVTLLTLETVATTSGLMWPNRRFHLDDSAGPRGSTSYHKMNPPNLQTLVAAGVDYVSLATNHAMDYECAGMMETVSALDDLNILHAGTGRSQSEAWRPATISRRGVDMRLYSFADYGNGWNTIGVDLQAASPKSAGINYLNTFGIRRVMPFAQVRITTLSRIKLLCGLDHSHCSGVLFKCEVGQRQEWCN